MKSLIVFTMLLLMVLMGTGILLLGMNRFPKRELALLWNKVSTGKSELDKEPPPPVDVAEEPSFDQVIRARASETREIKRQQQEVKTLLELASARQKELELQRQAVLKSQQELQKGYLEKQEAVVLEGRQNLLQKVEVMSPKIAKAFLLDQAKTDENVTLELIKKLDPVLAAKIFKEFKQPDEIERLNALLAKIGQGEPEKTDLETTAAAKVP